MTTGGSSDSFGKFLATKECLMLLSSAFFIIPIIVLLHCMVSLIINGLCFLHRWTESVSVPPLWPGGMRASG